MSGPTRAALWLTAYVMAGLLGRVTVLGTHNIGLIWPAAGVGLLWLVTSTRATWRLDLVLLATSTVAVLLLTDGGVVRSVLALATFFQTLLALWLLRRWVPGIWGTGGRVALSRLSEFGLLLLAVTTAALVTALLRTPLGVLLLTDDGFSLFWGRWGRNTAAMVTIGTFGLLLGGWLAERRDGVAPPLRVSRSDVAHIAGILVVTAGVFLAGFLLQPGVPTSFMLTLTAVWAGIRFSPVVAAGLSLATGAVTVWLTIEGYGPIASVQDPETRALVAQVFVSVLMVTSLTIALARREFFETIDRLEQSEATLGMRATELDMVMAHLDDGIAIVEEGGRLVHTNAALRTVFGTRPEVSVTHVPAEGDPEDQVFYPDGRPMPREESPYVRALGGETVAAEEFVLRSTRGPDMVLEVSAFPLPTPPEALGRAMVVVRDVTAASTHRDSLVSFAGTVAHDLNNPLSVIDGWAEALEDELSESDSPQIAVTVPMVQHIRATVEQMREFVSGLLAHSVARDQALECQRIALHTMVKHIVGTRDGPREGGEIVAGDLLDVWADPVLLRQVLDNLIGNAFKYVEPGTVPRVVIEADPLPGGWARIQVRDNGIGVPVSQRERIFDSFHRATAGYQGTGLGLAICRRIVQRHGGTIRVTDNPDGVGSCFEFTLPTTPEALRRATAP